ncbi:hypothetical protein [Polaromonas sp. DSR2-3-2]|uniref:hypothetical protein n=1 Tax=unclassified Polaromonas TaxID=2638319 RepID=UPI003CF31717
MSVSVVEPRKTMLPFTGCPKPLPTSRPINNAQGFNALQRMEKDCQGVHQAPVARLAWREHSGSCMLPIKKMKIAIALSVAE